MQTFIFTCFSLIILAVSCNDSKKATNISPDKLREMQINENKAHVKKESDEIDQYVKHRNWNMITTGTGLRYMIYEKGPGEKAVLGKLAKVNYKISLMDGTICYTSEKAGPKTFLIGQDAVENGLHEGIQLMKVGDKALFILPSHIAHGLIGDENKIPPRASVIYDIELLTLK